MSAAVIITLKQLANEKVHYSIIAIYASYLGLPFSLGVSAVMSCTGVEKLDQAVLRNPAALMLQVFYSLSSAFAGIFAQVFLNIAMKHEEASKIAIIKSSEFIFTYLFQYLWLNVAENVYSLVGACLIIFGTILILFYKTIERKAAKSNQKGRVLWKKILLVKF